MAAAIAASLNPDQDTAATHLGASAAAQSATGQPTDSVETEELLLLIA